MKKTRLFSLAMVIAMLFTCSFAFAEPEENTLPICTDGSSSSTWPWKAAPSRKWPLMTSIPLS